MNRRRWFFHLVIEALAHRKGRTLLMLAVLAMASSLVTALGIVSATMGERINEEVRKYGANLVIVADNAGLEVGSGGMNFGMVTEPAYVDQAEVARALLQQREIKSDSSAHLRGALQFNEKSLAVDGVNFPVVRRIFPWWRLNGSWPGADGSLAGIDIARRYGLKPGDELVLNGPAGDLAVTISGIVTTGGEEDGLLFVDLPALQKVLGVPGQVTAVRLVVSAGGENLRQFAVNLQNRLSGVRVQEVRQVARTSEALLKKVQLLMVLVTIVVVVACGGSVAGTMSSTVLERSREIGLMKAIGASRREVLMLFSAESLVLGLIGGLAGYGAGFGIAMLVTETVFSAAAAFIPGFVPVAVAVSIFLALLGSIGPMVAVYRLDPVCSLRGE